MNQYEKKLDNEAIKRYQKPFNELCPTRKRIISTIVDMKVRYNE